MVGESPTTEARKPNPRVPVFQDPRLFAEEGVHERIAADSWRLQQATPAGTACAALTKMRSACGQQVQGRATEALATNSGLRSTF